jgi:hypothetical protein
MLQNCADATAPKCTLSNMPAGEFPSTCQELHGSAAVGEDCTILDNSFGKDTCAPGLVCSPVERPQGSTLTCKPLCDSPDDCDSDQFCARFNNSAELEEDTRLIGMCLDVCEFFDSEGTCPEDTRCVHGGTIDLTINFACIGYSPGQEGDACTGANQCDAGLICRNGFCRYGCDPEHACPTGFACQTFISVLSICNPPPDTWSCDVALFSDGATCDCSCGGFDPDCAIMPGLPIVGLRRAERVQRRQLRPARVDLQRRLLRHRRRLRLRLRPDRPGLRDQRHLRMPVLQQRELVRRGGNRVAVRGSSTQRISRAASDRAGAPGQRPFGARAALQLSPRSRVRMAYFAFGRATIARSIVHVSTGCFGPPSTRTRSFPPSIA